MSLDKLFVDRNGYEEHNRKILSLKEELKDFAKNEAIILSEIKRLESQQDKMVIIDEVKCNDLINIDDVVTLVSHYEKNNETYTETIKLVGGSNPDIFADTPEISLNSPIGEAIYKQKVGDKVSCYVNNDCVNIEIIEKVLEQECIDDKKFTLKK